MAIIWQSKNILNMFSFYCLCSRWCIVRLNITISVKNICQWLFVCKTNVLWSIRSIVINKFINLLFSYFKCKMIFFGCTKQVTKLICQTSNTFCHYGCLILFSNLLFWISTINIKRFWVLEEIDSDN